MAGGSPPSHELVQGQSAGTVAKHCLSGRRMHVHPEACTGNSMPREVSRVGQHSWPEQCKTEKSLAPETN